MTTLELQFDSATHTYSLGDRILPSVTQVMESVGIIDYSFLPHETREMALERGRHVHTATQLDDEQDLDEASLTGELPQYLAAWRSFVATTGHRFSLIEHRMHHQFGFAGTLDRFVPIDAKSGIVIDIKTNTAPEWVALQLSAYAAMLEAERPGLVARRMAVELRRDGTFRAMEFRVADQRRDFETFLAALRVCQYKQLLSASTNRRRSI